MEFTIEIAGIPVKINSLFELSAEMCRDFFSKKEPEFTVTVTPEDIDWERKKSMDECALEGIEYPGYSPDQLEFTAIYRKIANKLPDYSAVVFHGSSVAIDGGAYLFTAKSGTGKTTHTKLWLKNIPGSYVVNGDKPVLRMIDGKAFVCGTPWMGKERMGCRENVLLKAICFLERGAENKITSVGFSENFPTMLSQTYRPPKSAALLKTVGVLEELGKTVSFYRLFCNMEDSAAEVSYNGMR